MTEPLRTDLPGVGPSSEADREARIEQLLLSGLDHYFAGKYEQAINVWTRVAFLERGHGRARAYIERARGALAERQRESEELLHSGVEAYHAGDLDSARDLLTRAVRDGGPNETALVFLQRLGRVEVVSPLPAPELPQRPLVSHQPHSSAERRAWALTVLVSALIAAAIAIIALPIGSWLAELPVTAPVAARVPVEPVPIVRTQEMRIERARALHAAGRPHEALRLLEMVDIADPLRIEADNLRADLQRELLALPAARSTASREPSR